MKKALVFALATILAFASTTTSAAWKKDKSAELDKKAQKALADFRAKDPSAEEFIEAAAGYAVIPSVGKAGLGIGGARGKGVLYEGGQMTAIVTLTQLSAGFQMGGQVYSEFLFFQNQAALDDFKNGNYELSAQASAVGITEGVSADAAFVNGMAIFTQAKGGLMYEAAVGGQKFKVEMK